MTPYYDDGRVTIYHGDCRDVLPGLIADLVLTDPPYGVGLDYGSDFVDSPEQVATLVADFLPLAMQVAPVVMLSPGIANMYDYPRPSWVLSWVFHQGARVPWGFNAWQPVLCYGKDPYLRKGKGGRPDAIVKTVGGGALVKERAALAHPCPKPLSAWKAIMLRGSPCEGELIVDPFMGSGTTLRAAWDLGRRAIGIEVNERYCEIAAKRCAQQTLDFGDFVDCGGAGS